MYLIDQNKLAWSRKLRHFSTFMCVCVCVCVCVLIALLELNYTALPVLKQNIILFQMKASEFVSALMPILVMIQQNNTAAMPERRLLKPTATFTNKMAEVNPKYLDEKTSRDLSSFVKDINTDTKTSIPSTEYLHDKIIVDDRKSTNPFHVSKTVSMKGIHVNKTNNDSVIKPQNISFDLHEATDIGIDENINSKEENIDGIVRKIREVQCDNRYEDADGNCQSLRTASICPWREVWHYNVWTVECLTCRPTTGCDDNCLLTCQHLYMVINGVRRAVACIAATPCIHNTAG